MFKMVQVIERNIGKEMQCTKGAVMYDGWSSNGVHFIGIFALYMRKIQSYGQKKTVGQKELCLNLISFSPMSKVNAGKSSDNDEEAETFNAVTHTNQMKEIFLYYGVHLSKWVVCQVADSATINRRIAKDLGMPHIGCLNHKLNNEVERMVNNYSALASAIDSVNKTMLDFKTKLTNRAMLRNIETLSPVVHNKTRWSEKYLMLKRFLILREKFISVSDSADRLIHLNRTLSFKKTVEE